MENKRTATLSQAQTISTKRIPATNTRGQRVKASLVDGPALTIAWDYAKNNGDNHKEAALALMNLLEWDGKVIGGAVKTGYVWVFDFGG